jgi:acetyltransferase-like isoleucine patch superfamily enzyme
MNFKKKIKSFLKRKLAPLIYSLIQEIKEEEKTVNNLSLRKKVLIHPQSVLYEEASINNFSEKPENIRIGKNSHVRGRLLVFANGGNILLGENCYIGENSNIWSGESIIIDDNVLISHNVNVIDTNSHELNHEERNQNFVRLISEGHPKTKGNVETRPIHIKKNSWINFNSVILKGVTIGEGSIVAAGSIVTKDVPDWTVVAGNPAKIIRHLNNG